MINWKSNSLTVSKTKRYIKCTISSKRWRSITRIHGTRNLRWSYIEQKMRKMLSLMSYCNMGSIYCWQFTITFINKTQHFYGVYDSLPSVVVESPYGNLSNQVKDHTDVHYSDPFHFKYFYCANKNYLFIGNAFIIEDC